MCVYFIGKVSCLILSLNTQAGTCCLSGSRVIWQRDPDFRDTSLYLNKLNPERVSDMILKKGGWFRKLVVYNWELYREKVTGSNTNLIQNNNSVIHRVCGKYFRKNWLKKKTFIVIICRNCVCTMGGIDGIQMIKIIYCTLKGNWKWYKC